LETVRMNKLAAKLDELGGADITQALEELPLRSFIVDRDGIIHWQNAASRAARGDLAGTNWFDLVDGDTEDARAVLGRILCSGDPAEITLDIREKGGEVAPREISAAPLREGATVVGVFGVSVAAKSQAARADVPAHSPLTERQREILQLLAEGKSTDQIADELVLSKTTVRNHIAHVLANLGVHSRVQAIVVASRDGLIQLSTPSESSDS
jgi:DNA-binding CsgD family transcriptional regulator